MKQPITSFNTMSAAKKSVLDNYLSRRESLALRGSIPGVKARQRAFTLIELLVVIAIIAILASILMPVLDKAKIRAQTAYCLNNMRELQICYLMYVHDNNDNLPMNGGTVQTSEGGSWANQSNAQADTNPNNLMKCAFYQYNNQVKIYQCPANAKMLKVPPLPLPPPPLKAGQLVLQTRTCQIDYTLNDLSDGQAANHGGNYIRWLMTQIVNGKGTPGTSKKVVFVDANQDWVQGGAFGIFGNGDTADIAQTGFINAPGNRHANGATLSFADGHVEAWRWRGYISYDTNSASPVCDATAKQYDAPRLAACEFDYYSQP